MSNLDDYKTEHLFLLIGENPLPNYVAAKLLAKCPQTATEYNGGKPMFHLICSAETKKYAENLQKVLGKTDFNYGDFIEVDPSDFDNIGNSLDDRLGKIETETSDSTIGLNYTGGTKAMSVHAYRALETLTNKRTVKPKFSYLDARNLEMRFDRKDNNYNQISFKLAHFHKERDPNEKTEIKKRFDATAISLENLLNLHGLKVINQPRRASLISKSNLNKLLNGAKRNDVAWSQFKETVSTQNNFNVVLPDGSNLSQTPTSVSAKDFCQDYLAKGKWFEDFVLEKALEVKDDCNLGDCVSNLETEHPDRSGLTYFEIDVLALRGYQLFAVSCTLDTNKDNCKKKLFEIAARARQIGGSEARIGLVCLVSDNDKTILTYQLDKQGVLVAGIQDLNYLDEWLKDWFKS